MERRLGPATRDTYGKKLVELGKANPNIVVLDGDLSKSTKTEYFCSTFPERFFNVGIAEANLVGIAAGLAACGKIPFISSFACFLICKGYDQLRMAVSFSELNVKVVASHGGISVGEDGASQQSIEDYALALTLPKFVVCVPADEASMNSLLPQVADHKGPVYIRTCRPKAPVIYSASAKLELGKGVLLKEGKDVTIFAVGLLVFEALQAAEELAAKGIQASVVDLHTIKPIDRDLIVKQVKQTGAAVVCEEHTIYGGLGSVVSEVIAEKNPVPVEFISIHDTYAESGTGEELLERYELTAPYIVKAAERAVSRRK